MSPYVKVRVRKKRNRKKDLRANLLVAAMMAFVMVVLFLFLVGGGPLFASRSPLGWISKTFSPVIVVPGEQADGTFLFAGFETLSDLRPWSVVSAKVDLTKDYASKGEYSVRVHFYGNSRLASMVMEDYFTSRFGLSDWTDYEFLGFHIFNPDSNPAEINFQIKDDAGERYKQRLQIPSATGKDFLISIDEIANAVNIGHIDQMNFYVWDHKADREINLDDIRLIPRKTKPEGGLK